MLRARFCVALFALVGAHCGTGAVVPDASDVAHSVDASDAARDALADAPREAALDAADVGTPSDVLDDAGSGLAPGFSPPLVSRGGAVLVHPQLVTVTYANDPSRDALERYGAAMVADPWWSAGAGEYGVGALTLLGNARLADNAPTTATQAQIESYLVAQSAAGTLPRNADGGYEGIVYMVYFPAGTRVTLRDGAAACSGWHGVHGEVTSGSTHFVYAMVLDCGPGRGFDHLGYLEAAASHELLEAATDPFVVTDPAFMVSPTEPSPWSIYGELTDRCVGQYLTRGEFVLARNWSNAASLLGDDPCVPTDPGAVYYGVWTPETTLHGAPGATITVALTGFARGSVSAFALRVYAAAGFNTTPALDRGRLGAGARATLRLTIPSAATSGALAWVVVLVGPDDGDSRNYPLMVRVD